ncbi:MAG: hypothetical protein KDI06_22980 [Calditrichaeota bacterium]|nr:hypothetical protein [Calditrichota bacterium]
MNQELRNTAPLMEMEKAMDSYSPVWNTGVREPGMVQQLARVSSVSGKKRDDLFGRQESGTHRL